MRFIKDSESPNIPEELFYAQEKGELVLFCGAGISVYTGLPGFKDLVNNISENKNIDFEIIEKDEFKKANFDRVLGL